MERRKHPRFLVRFRSTFSSVNRVVGEGVVCDLSIRGCKIESDTTVSPGTDLKLRLYVPEVDPSIEIAVATVRWTNGRNFGLEFLDMKEADWTRLSEAIKTLETGEAH
jgi:hypothetical protein